MKASVFRKEHFNAAHRLHNPSWTLEKNQAVFGKCNNPHYHGHNYILEVKVTGEVDRETGYVIDAKILKELIHRNVIDRYDHKNLNLDVDDFKETNPTAENIAIKIYEQLRPELNANLALKIRLYETDKNYVEFPVD